MEVREVENKEQSKSVQELALLELSRNARILQRQMKIMRGLRLNINEQTKANEIIWALEQEFQMFRM